MTALTDLPKAMTTLGPPPGFLAFTFSPAGRQALAIKARQCGWRPPTALLSGAAEIHVVDWQPEPYLIWCDEANLRKYLALTAPPMILPERLLE